MFSAKLRQKEIDNYNSTVNRYEDVAKDLSKNSSDLYEERKKALEVIKLVEELINCLANTPKEFKVAVKKMEIEVKSFKEKQQDIKKAEVEAKAAAGSSGATATLSALGIAVATMGPTAAMGIATTFGVASTGTAISSLTGAAATNAILAWLGGGALAAGGGGISAGSALIALAGPVGWTIAGVAFASSICAGLVANYKNKKTADKLVLERNNLEKVIRKFNAMNSEVKALLETTQNQLIGVTEAKKAVIGSNYSEFYKEEKIQVGLLVNSTLTLAQLINKELKLDV